MKKKNNTIKETKTEYQLTLTEKQAELLSRACEFYSRMMLGQWKELIWDCANFKELGDSYSEKTDEAERYLLEARSCIMPKLIKSFGHSYGVGKFEDTDIVWEIYEVLRNKIAWENNPEGDWTVNFDKPISFSGYPLAECKVINSKNNKDGNKNESV